MLRVLRKHAQSPLIQAVVVVIAVVFVFWGVGTNLGNRGNAAATVDDQLIDGPSYGRAYDRLLDVYRRQFGGLIPDNLLNNDAIRRQAVGQLVRQALARKGAEELGIIIGDPEVRRTIAAMPAFQTNGTFDPAAYKAVLAQNRYSENAFEEGLRNDLQRDRAMAEVTAFAVTPEGEIDQWLNFINLEIRLDYALFSLAEHEKKVETDEAASAAWFEGRKEQYRPAPQYKFSYLAFPFAADVAEARVGEEEMRAYYNEQAESWRVPEQRHLRHILFRVEPGAPDELKAARKREADQALDKIRAGADFAKLADELTEDPSGKGKGGDLGMIVRGRTVPQFEAEAFSLDAGAVSGVVESPFGFHIIKVESVRPAGLPGFEEKRAEIERILAERKARNITFKKASTAYEEVIRAGSLAKYAEAGHEPAVTDYLEQGVVPEGQGLLRDPAVSKAAFALGKGELSSIVEGAEGYAVVFADDVKTMDVPPLDAVRERVLADFRREKGAELARKAADEALASLEKDGAWPAGVRVRRSDFLKRGDAGGAPDQTVVQDAFARLGMGRLPQAPVSLGDDFAVYRIVGARRGGETMPPAMREALRAQLEQGRRDRLFNQWLDGIRRRSKIWVNPEIFK